MTAVALCCPLNFVATAHASEHDDAVAALSYQCTGEEVDVYISLDDAATAAVRLEADLFPYCLTTVDVSHCQDESCRESAVDACLADSILEWDFGDGSGWSGGATVTHGYGGAGVFALNVSVKTGQAALPGATCELTLRPTQVTWALKVLYPDLSRPLAVGDRFEVSFAVTTTLGVGGVEDFGFESPGVLTIDSSLFAITSSSQPAIVTGSIGPGESIWSGSFVVEALAEGAGLVGVAMHYVAEDASRFGHARARVVVGVDPVSGILPVVHYLLGMP
jgi:hypothetical protein